MLSFSRLVLNESYPEARRDLGDCGRIHRRILRAFPALEQAGSARDQLGLLYRLESPDENSAGWCLLVQARHEPDWASLPAQYLARPPEVKAIDEAYARIAEGLTLRFRLRANPTKRVARRDDPRWNGRRVALRGEEEQLAWLERKGTQNGFALTHVRASAQVVDVRSSSQTDVTGRLAPAGGQPAPAARLTFGSTLFEGLLQVQDAACFRLALEEGLGSGKAFGFGLLSVAPAR